MEVLRRDVGICIAAVLILATILLPGLLLRGPAARLQGVRQELQATVLLRVHLETKVDEKLQEV